MNRPDLAAAFRLATSLPVRTHVRAEAESSHWRQTQKANHTRSIRVRGVVYESLAAAAQALGCGRDKIRLMARAGEAVYVDGRAINRRQAATPIRYQGRTYDGVKDACQRLRIGKTKLYALIASGEAVRQ